MPYVNIKVTQEGGTDGTGPTAEEKAQLISGVTDLLRTVLNKDPATTFVGIEEVPLEYWCWLGRLVSDFRSERELRCQPSRHRGVPNAEPALRRIRRPLPRSLLCRNLVLPRSWLVAAQGRSNVRSETKLMEYLMPMRSANKRHSRNLPRLVQFTMHQCSASCRQ